MELPFAGVHQLCAPMLGRLDALPEPQRSLRVALGLSHRARPRTGSSSALAVLSLLSAVAEERPLLCLVDDAQWLDAASEQVLGFVARRLLAESVAIVFAVREPSDGRELDGLPSAARRARRGGCARAPGESHPGPARRPGPRPDRRRDPRQPARAAGAAPELSAAELAGGFELPATRRSAGSASRALPAAARRAARGDAAAAGARRGRSRGRRDAGVAGGRGARDRTGAVVPRGGCRAARDRSTGPVPAPTRASAVYRARAAGRPARAHAALAEAGDPELDPDRRAWHRALAAEGPDDDVAAELERLGGARADARRARGSRRVSRTRGRPDGRPRAPCTPGAGRRAGKHQAGDPDAALALLASAEAGPLDLCNGHRATCCAPQITFTSRPRDRRAPAPARAAKQLEPLDATLARETYLEALMAVQFAGPLADGAALGRGEAARAAPPSPAPSAPDLLLDGLALLIAEGTAPPRRCLRAPWTPSATAIPLRTAASGGSGSPRRRPSSCGTTTLGELAAREVELVRDAGALTALPHRAHASDRRPHLRR